MLNEKKFNELSKLSSNISNYYISQNNGFYKCKDLSESEKCELKKFFNEIGFSALNFTDSRGIFQFYNLAYLWGHIEKALANNIKKLNLATEPIVVSELYEHIKGQKFVNEVAPVPPKYDFKTKHASIFGGKNEYIFSKECVMDDIREFVNAY